MSAGNQSCRWGKETSPQDSPHHPVQATKNFPPPKEAQVPKESRPTSLSYGRLQRDPIPSHNRIRHEEDRRQQHPRLHRPPEI